MIANHLKLGGFWLSSSFLRLMDGIEMESSGSAPSTPVHHHPDPPNMKDEIDEHFSIIKIEISSEHDEVSARHPKTRSEGLRRSSRKRKAQVKTVMIDTDEEHVPKKLHVKNISNQPTLPLNISKLEKDLGKCLVVSLTRCDLELSRLIRKKIQSNWRKLSRVERVGLKLMTKNERAWHMRKEELEELKKMGFPTPELKPFKYRKTPEEKQATARARYLRNRKTHRVVSEKEKVKGRERSRRYREKMKILRRNGEEEKQFKPGRKYKTLEEKKAAVKAWDKMYRDRRRAAKEEEDKAKEEDHDDHNCLPVSRMVGESYVEWRRRYARQRYRRKNLLCGKKRKYRRRRKKDATPRELKDKNDDNSPTEVVAKEELKKKQESKDEPPCQVELQTQILTSSSWQNRTPEEWARIRKMTRSERAWERRKKQVEELKKLGVPTKELKPFQPRRKRKTLEEIKVAEKARNVRYREQIRELINTRAEEVATPPTTVEPSQTQLLELLSIVDKPAPEPLLLPKRYTKHPDPCAKVDRNRYVKTSSYHLKTRLLKEKAKKDSIGDSSPLSIPALYGIPFSELTPPEQEIVLELLDRHGSALNVKGEWSPKIEALKAEKHAEMLKNAENLRNSSIPCPVCDSYFPGLLAVKDHLKSHSKDAVEPWFCKFCVSAYASAAALYSHYRDVHLKLNEFFCRVCGKGFGEKCRVDKHEMTHWSEEKLLEEGMGVICQSCGKVLAKHSIRDHEIKVHGTGCRGKEARGNDPGADAPPSLQMIVLYCPLLCY